jgi:Na+/H+ antiporter NhaD/arsenite permease-like protein
MEVALIGLFTVLAYKFSFTSFDLYVHLITGQADHHGEWRILLNLTGLLFGFGLLAKYFEKSNIAEYLPNFLPNDWKGAYVLLLLIAVMSSFLDNIAAGVIGFGIAYAIFNGRIHLGYIAGIIMASNAGGAPSVVGDTTTTMMWIEGVKPGDVFHAIVGTIVIVLFSGYFAAKQQDGYQRIQKDNDESQPIDWIRIGIVIMILVGAILANFVLDFPAVGVWAAIIIGNFIRKADWKEIPETAKGVVFLISLVFLASMMPVESLPPASPLMTSGLGFVSALFDNIPLTALCLKQGGYDWGFLAFCVGVGGSMMWFGSSAGVAVCGEAEKKGYTNVKNVFAYLRAGWHVVVGYVLACIVMYLISGWHPHEIVH